MLRALANVARTVLKAVALGTPAEIQVIDIFHNVWGRDNMSNVWQTGVRG